MSSNLLLMKSTELVELSSGSEENGDDEEIPGPSSKTAWKSLMELMQKNQKSGAGVATTKTNGKKNGMAMGRGLKRTVSQPQPFQTTIGNTKSSDSDNFISEVKRRRLSDIEKLTGANSGWKEEYNEYNNNTLANSNAGAGAGALTLGPKSQSVTSVNIKSEAKVEQKSKKIEGPVFPIFVPKGEGKGAALNLSSNVDSKCWSQEKIPVTLHVPSDEDVKKAATAAAKANNGNGNKRECPFYKKIPGTAFSIDAFSYGLIPGIDVYFLSHFHSDHYIGLTKKFQAKTIVCSPATGNLVEMKLGISEDCVRKLELNKIYLIQGTEVVLVDANHCPGSVMFIFRLPNGRIIFHTGDFRFTPDMLMNPFVASLPRVDTIYLDTTYCDPKFDFPSQTDAIAQVLESVKRHVEYRPSTLIVCGAYCIGKERVFFAIAEALNLRVFCETDKRRVIRALETPAFLSHLEDEENMCGIHVLPMRDLNPVFLAEYLSQRSGVYTNVLAIKPTGWEFSRTGTGLAAKQYFKDTVTVIGVPYSEHSSFSELRQFVSALKPFKIQPTVNVGSEAKRTSMNTYFHKWLTGNGKF